jgi:hypothetical protein
MQNAPMEKMMTLSNMSKIQTDTSVTHAIRQNYSLSLRGAAGNRKYYKQNPNIGPLPHVFTM